MTVRVLGVMCWGMLVAGNTFGQTEAPQTSKPTSRDYLIGVSVVSAEDTLGSEKRRLRLQPLWSVQLGRFRLSTSRADALWQLGRESIDPGLSTVLRSGENLSLSTSLQLDPGREAASDPIFRGLPDIRDTLRGRLTARYTLDDRWFLRGVLSTDLLGRDGGTTATALIGYRQALSARTRIDLSAASTWGDGKYLRTHYGIAPVDAARSGQRAFVPGAGLFSTQLGAEISTALSPNWVVFGGVGYTLVQGDARHSPLVTRRNAWSANAGLAYRCC